VIFLTQLCKIVPERCIACGLCNVYAPQIFDYDEEGIVLFTQNKKAHQQFIQNEQKEQVLLAYKKCPTRAILLEDLSS
jgi:ferredoxin